MVRTANAVISIGAMQAAGRYQPHVRTLDRADVE
jgi:hypothetical protein